MSIFAIMNYVVWGLCAFIVLLLAKDILGVEKQRRREQEEQTEKEK